MKSKLISLVFGLFVACVLGEIAARVRLRYPALPPEADWPAPRGFYAADAQTGFTLNPGFHYADEQWTTNALGFRDRERDPAAPRRGLRVVVLGDSFASGAGVADGQQFGALAEQAATAAGLESEWWTLAVPHFGTEQSLLRLRQHWDALRPDIVVLATFVGNDAWDDLMGPGHYRVRDGVTTKSQWAPWPATPFNDLRAQGNRPLYAHHLPGDWLLQRYSALYRGVMGGVSILRGFDAEEFPYGLEPFDYEAWGGIPWLMLSPPPPPVEIGWTIQEEVVAALHKECLDRSVALWIVGIPARTEVDRGDLRRALERGWETGPRRGGGSRDGRRTLDVDLPMRRLESLAARQKVPLLDLRSQLRDGARAERLYYDDDSHWNAAGHRVAADAVLRFAKTRPGFETLDLDRATEHLLTAVPVGSAPAVFEGGFRPERPDRFDGGQGRGDKRRGGRGERPDRGDRDGAEDEDDEDGGGKAGKGGKGGKGSEVAARLIPPEQLVAALPRAFGGFTCGEVSSGDESLGGARAEVFVRVVRRSCRGPGGAGTIELIDGGNQAEMTDVLSREGAAWRTGALPNDLPRTAARFALRWVGTGAVDVGAVPAPDFDGLEARFSHDRIGPLFTVPPGPPATLRARLHDPAALVPALPVPPPGWQGLDIVPLHRPHDPLDGGARLSPESEALLADPSVDRSAQDPWTAQVKRWYRGPDGAFEGVVQDTGRQEILLRSRQSRIEPFRTGTQAIAMQEEGRDRPTVRPFRGAGLEGFRTCLDAQGLCKVVLPIVDPKDPRAAIARYNLILMGPAGAPDSAFEALAAGLGREALRALDGA